MPASVFTGSPEKSIVIVSREKQRRKIKKSHAKTQSFRKAEPSMPNRFLNNSQTARICHSRESAQASTQRNRRNGSHAPKGLNNLDSLLTWGVAPSFAWR